MSLQTGNKLFDIDGKNIINSYNKMKNYKEQISNESGNCFLMNKNYMGDDRKDYMKDCVCVTTNLFYFPTFIIEKYRGTYEMYKHSFKIDDLIAVKSGKERERLELRVNECIKLQEEVISLQNEIKKKQLERQKERQAYQKEWRMKQKYSIQIIESLLQRINEMENKNIKI